MVQPINCQESKYHEYWQTMHSIYGINEATGSLSKPSLKLTFRKIYLVLEL